MLLSIDGTYTLLFWALKYTEGFASTVEGKVCERVWWLLAIAPRVSTCVVNEVHECLKLMVISDIGVHMFPFYPLILCTTHKCTYVVVSYRGQMNCLPTVHTA